VLLQDVMECGDDSSSDWLDPSTVTSVPNNSCNIVSSSTEVTTSENGNNVLQSNLSKPLIFLSIILFGAFFVTVLNR